MTRYKPPESLDTPRFTGIRTFMRLPYRDPHDVDVDLVVLGIPFDSTQTFRTGARFGPQAIRDFSILLRPYNPSQKIQVFDYLSAVDGGDVPVVPGNVRETYRRMVEYLTPLYQRGIIPLCMGGDHSVSLGELRAAHRAHGVLSLVQFDAHSDTWDEYYGEKYTHGTPFRRAVEEELIDPQSSIQIGMRGPLYSPGDLENAKQLGFEIYTTEELREIGVDEMIRRIRRRVGDRPVFLSFDIDFFDPSQAPGTGTPEVAGPSVHTGLRLLRGLDGLDFRGLDCVEVLPAYDHGQITAAAASNVMFELMSLVARNRRDS